MKLTATQTRALLTIQRMCDSDEEIAHDLEGDLSLTSRNWPRTAQVLEARGFITGHFDHYRPIEEAWTCRITDLGREALDLTSAMTPSQESGE
jgi:DNA-binding MarR family transcriptional regulator